MSRTHGQTRREKLRNVFLKKSLCFLVKNFEAWLNLETFDQLCSEPGVRKGIVKIQSGFFLCSSSKFHILMPFFIKKCWQALHGTSA